MSTAPVSKKVVFVDRLYRLVEHLQQGVLFKWSYINCVSGLSVIDPLRFYWLNMAGCPSLNSSRPARYTENNPSYYPCHRTTHPQMNDNRVVNEMIKALVNKWDIHDPTVYPLPILEMHPKERTNETLRFQSQVYNIHYFQLNHTHFTRGVVPITANRDLHGHTHI